MALTTVVVVVVGALATHAVSGSGGSTARRASTTDAVDGPAPAPSPSGATPSVSISATASQSAAGDQIRWDATLGVALPVSITQGPSILTPARAASFGASQLGAALAAVHLLARTSPRVGPAVFTPVLDEQVYGPNRQALADTVRAGYADEAAQLGLEAGEPLPGADAELVGYRIIHFADSDAAVEVVLSSTALRVDGHQVAVRVSLQRTDDDWVLIAPPRGDWGVVTTVLTTQPTDVLTFGEGA